MHTIDDYKKILMVYVKVDVMCSGRLTLSDVGNHVGVTANVLSGWMEMV